MTALDPPKAPPNLSGRHRHTYDAIFRHPAAHNLEWHDVRSLLAALADLTEGHNRALQLTRNGHVVTQHIPKNKDVATIDDLLTIRHFLEQSANLGVAPAVELGTHLLVIIDHHEAKIYRTDSQGTAPE